MTIPLFPDQDPAVLEQKLRESFKAWVEYRARSGSTARSERPLKDESAIVYQEMWHAFAAYCASRSLDTTTVEAADIKTFLALRGAGNANGRPRPSTKGQELSPRYAWRMLTLIDRVTRFQARCDGVTPNPAATELLQLSEYRYANASHRDPLPDYCTEAQAKRLIGYLTEIRHSESASGPLTWKEVRDRTAVALMLGAGLTPGDVRVMTLDGVAVAGGRKAGVPWKLALPGNGNAPARETPVAEWAGRQLALWLSIREAQNIDGELVFPSTRSGKPWSHTGCYESCKAVLSGAGMGDEGGGVFKLRHTFALRQLAKGKTETEVARWLGILDINSMARYRHVLPNQVDVV
ncbi:tyrosine-type recombinase/integrase [Noviherbaspirillum sp. CPCC 100848]|uniref:Tyrosine-type recombinase/integrase n=1 Tax=Noviherbaspirillum album TaxID=3080276 RepID=A0ABU6JG25_9BURK|nr:tyrosine-type recombinase/integrase [Noviherbaspirillum sp. CPCC 100848]MEC4722421.1 tyrosine-type recombinase/integrase [Noviherbaspirillum sp. CPCC 100848]